MSQIRVGWPPQGISGGVPHYRRYIWDNLVHISNPVAVAVRVYLCPVEIMVPMTVDRVMFINNTVSTGNFRVGIYYDNGDTPAGGALIVESGSVATVGVSQKQEVTIADTSLDEGLYWLAFQKSLAADSHFCNYTRIALGGTLQTHTYASAYGAFTDPCPAVAATGTVPILGVRVASVP